MNMKSVLSDTEKLIALLTKKGRTIADRTTKGVAEEWITNHISELVTDFKGNPSALKSLQYLKHSVTNDRLLKKEWLKHLRLIKKALKEKNFTVKAVAPKKRTVRDKNLTLFNSRKFHYSIIGASQKLFWDGHYSQAIFESCKVLNRKVQQLSGSSLDGKKLMLTIFSVNNPKLKFNLLTTQSDKDEQEGFMHIFAGAIQGIRNPKGHDIINLRDPIKALEYLSFLSLLFRRLDELAE